MAMRRQGSSATRTCMVAIQVDKRNMRVPCADFGAFKIPDELTDEQILFLTDTFPTGLMAADNCGIEPGQTVAVWGCGPVGQFAIRSAFLLGAVA